MPCCGRSPRRAASAGPCNGPGCLAPRIESPLFADSGRIPSLRMERADAYSLRLDDAGLSAQRTTEAPAWVDPWAGAEPLHGVGDRAACTAGTAFGSGVGQADRWIDRGRGQARPRWSSRLARRFGSRTGLREAEGSGSAGGHTGPFGTQMTAAIAQIQRRRAQGLGAAADGQGEHDPVRTGGDAVAAARAGHQEIEFGQRKGRADPTRRLAGGLAIRRLHGLAPRPAQGGLEEASTVHGHRRITMGCIRSQTSKAVTPAANSTKGASRQGRP